MSAARIPALAALVALAACTGDIDPAWQLDHTRIIAVRATPPGITAGQTSALDALLATKGAKTSVATPQLARVASPASLASALSFDGTSWVVTAPSDDQLAAARSQLGLAAGAPVPLEVGVSYDGNTLIATKEIELGMTDTNPDLVGLMINGTPAPPAGTPITIGKQVTVPLAITADNAVDDVTWLTSCGTMHDFDLPNAHIIVESGDPDIGELAVVLRTPGGGVAWSVWPIQAQ